MDRRLTKYLFIAFGLVALIACLALASQNASAIDAHLNYDGWEWHYNTAVPATLTRVVQTGATTEITIPANVDGSTPLTTIGDSCFYDAEGAKITKVLSMPATITAILDNAFHSCVLMTSCNIGSGVTIIHAAAFKSCTALTSIIIPNSVTALDAQAFMSCTSATSLTIGTGLTAIGDTAFSTCTALATVTIPNNVASIGVGAFTSCTALTSATIQGGTIGNDAFNFCTAMTTLVVGNGVTAIGDRAFKDCSHLVSATIGNGVISIGVQAFYNDVRLTSITIGTGLTTIRASAFIYCEALASITFYGLVAPTSVGADWITGILVTIRGHAYAASNFPAPGNDFHGLTMGDYIYVPPPVLYPPIITTLPTLSVNIGYSYTYSALANQSVVWVITSNASWASISNNSISGIVNILNVGEYYVHIVGSNANGTVYQNYTVTVMAPITTLSDTSIIWLVLLLTFTAIGIIRVRLFGIFTGIIWIVAALIFFYPSYGYILMLFPLGFGMLWMVISLNELMSTEVKA